MSELPRHTNMAHCHDTLPRGHSAQHVTALKLVGYSEEGDEAVHKILPTDRL